MYLNVASKAIIAAGAALVGLFSILGFGGGFDAIVNMQVLQVRAKNQPELVNQLIIHNFPLIGSTIARKWERLGSVEAW